MRWPWAPRLDGGESGRHADLENVVRQLEVVSAQMNTTADRLQQLVGTMIEDEDK